MVAHNRTSQAQFKCVQCGYENHADVVGALNVLARGYRVIACGEEVAGSGLEDRNETVLGEAGTRRSDYA